MPGRQFTMMSAGCTMQNYQVQGKWQAINFSLVTSPTVAYYTTERLDLRGLLAGKEQGISISNVILQEAAPVRLPTTAREASCMVFDCLTTVPLTDENMAQWFDSTTYQANVAGMLKPADMTGVTSSDQELNPSQIVWGLWRWIVKDAVMSSKPGEFEVRTINSGYWGEGETIVAPNLYWTRLVFVTDNITQGTSYPAVIPSANLVVLGEAVDLTTAQEVTQMIRAAQR